MTPIQAASYFSTYHELVSSSTQTQLQDVYGFLVSGTAPLEQDHPYGKFITLEDTFVNELKTFQHEMKTGVPFVRELLAAELGFGDNINPKFYELLTASKEE